MTLHLACVIKNHQLPSINHKVQTNNFFMQKNITIYELTEVYQEHVCLLKSYQKI